MTLHCVWVDGQMVVIQWAEEPFPSIYCLELEVAHQRDPAIDVIRFSALYECISKSDRNPSHVHRDVSKSLTNPGIFINPCNKRTADIHEHPVSNCLPDSRQRGTGICYETKSTWVPKNDNRIDWLTLIAFVTCCTGSLLLSFNTATR